MTTLYGIKNCDTVKKARSWLAQHRIDHRFHDFRVDGLSRQQLSGWCQTLGWEQILNRRSTSWRNLPEAAKTNIDETSAIELMLAQPTLIKRPLADTGDQVIVGFNPSLYQQLFLEA